jgi:putative peptidoglycan lipid II flippase
MKTARWQKLARLGNVFRGGSVNRRIFGAAAIVGFGTTLVKLVAVLKELVVAYTFGTADELDAFLIASIVPSLIVTIVSGSFHSALIPTYIKARDREGMPAAQRLFASSVVWSIGLLVVTTCLMLVTAPLYLPAIAKGFSPEKLTLTYHLLWVLSPLLMFTGIGTIWGAILNAGERFILVALVPLLTSGVTILLLVTFKSWGVFNLAIGITIGQFLEMVAIGIVLHKQGMSLIPRWHGSSAYLREVASQYAPSMAGAFLMCSTALVDRSMATLLTSGSVSALEYGNRIVSLPIIIASTAVSTVVMPYFSKLVASEDWQSIRRSLKHYLFLIFAASIPLTLVIIFCSEPIVILLLKRGSFNANDARLVAQIQICFAFQIPFYIAGMLVVKLISALRQNHFLVWGSAGNLIINIGLNFLFVRWLGVAGIALSTSFVYIFSFSFLLAACLNKLRLTDPLALSPQQKKRIQELRQSKSEQIVEIIGSEQFELSHPEKLSEPTYRLSRAIELTDIQKSKLASVRQKNLKLFRSILTYHQLAKLDRLQNAAFTEIEKILTTKQLDQFRAMKNSDRQSLRDWHSLNLTTEQQRAIKNIRKAYERQIK